MLKKPNQIIDEVMNLVYPPTEAIIPQLSTIRAVATSTIKVYESTGDIHSIFPNLDMIQRAIDYLRGAPLPDELKPLPEDKLKPEFTASSDGVTIQCSINKNGGYDVSIVGIDVEPKISNPDLFGDIQDVMEVTLKIPVICDKVYLVAQENAVLENYKDDPYVMFYEPDQTWIKEKEYVMDSDTFEYSFLLTEGRTNAKISIYADYEDPIDFNITSHLHFKEPVEPEQPEYQGVKLTSQNSNTRVKKVSYNNGVTVYNIEGTNLNPNIKPNKELFGELDFNAAELKLNIPVICYRSYKITQYNPALEHFISDDPDVYLDEDRGYYKEKEYMTTKDDIINYSFLAENGRNEIIIYLEDEKGTIWKYIINAHIHFKESN